MNRISYIHNLAENLVWFRASIHVPRVYRGRSALVLLLRRPSDQIVTEILTASVAVFKTKLERANEPRTLIGCSTQWQCETRKVEVEVQPLFVVLIFMLTEARIY